MVNAESCTSPRLTANPTCCISLEGANCPRAWKEELLGKLHAFACINLWF
uniref:Uncharacterized protein n=1 Tax=Rhizophora mucronata TaxID=61149 RepID=A0A2P2LVW4_RHIMU